METTSDGNFLLTGGLLTSWHRATDYCASSAKPIAEAAFKWMLESGNLSSVPLKANPCSCICHVHDDMKKGVWHSHNTSEVTEWFLARHPTLLRATTRV